MNGTPEAGNNFAAPSDPAMAAAAPEIFAPLSLREKDMAIRMPSVDKELATVAWLLRGRQTVELFAVPIPNQSAKLAQMNRLADLLEVLESAQWCNTYRLGSPSQRGHSQSPAPVMTNVKRQSGGGENGPGRQHSGATDTMGSR